MDIYKDKYIKYKIKYNELKMQEGGALIICPYCNNKIHHMRALEHISFVHNIILTQEQLNQILKQKHADKFRSIKSSGRYNVNCRFCNKSIHSKAPLAYHIMVNHYELIAEEDFNLIDEYISSQELFKSRKARQNFVRLEIKFNKINVTPDMNMEQLTNPEEIKARRLVRNMKNTRTKRKLLPLNEQETLNDLELLDSDYDDTTDPAADGAIVDAAAADFYLPDDYNVLFGPETLPVTLPVTLPILPNQYRFEVPPDFELNTIPVDLLFESMDVLPIAREQPNMNCRYCGLNFNRYNLAKHLLRHYTIINLEDLEFIKSVIPKGINHLRNIHIINKIYRKIIARDKQLQAVNFLPSTLNEIDLTTLPIDNTVPINEFDPELFDYLTETPNY
jgi:hypothetical protein